MRWRGLEPPRPKGHKALNLARLPIPPPARGRAAFYSPDRSTTAAQTIGASSRSSVSRSGSSHGGSERPCPSVAGGSSTRKPGPVGRDLDQDPVGHPEVDRAEVLAILLRGRPQAELGRAGRCQAGLLGVVRRCATRRGGSCRRRSAPPPRPARRKASGASSSKRPGVEVGVAERDDVVQPGLLAGIEPEPAARPGSSTSISVPTVGVYEPDRLERPAAEPAAIGPRPLEERDQASRRARLVTEVEVVAVRVVEVDRLLDQREAELVAVEVGRPLRVAAHARDVMKPAELHGRGYASRR